LEGTHKGALSILKLLLLLLLQGAIMVLPLFMVAN
jgi:hypothetical protein